VQYGSIEKRLDNSITIAIVDDQLIPLEACLEGIVDGARHEALIHSRCQQNYPLPETLVMTDGKEVEPKWHKIKPGRGGVHLARFARSLPGVVHFARRYSVAKEADFGRLFLGVCYPRDGET